MNLTSLEYTARRYHYFSRRVSVHEEYFLLVVTGGLAQSSVLLSIF